MSNPHIEDAAYWDAASECYHRDRIDEAYMHVAPRGIGEAGYNIRLLRLIEAEAIVRERGTQTQINDWLSLETIPEETIFCEHRIGRTALSAAKAVEDILDWADWPQVLLCILSRESETPWATNPNGYWIPKDEYDKICLPFYLLDDEDELLKACVHELAHVATSAISDGHASTWLHEAVSMLLERTTDPSSSALEEPSAWLDPNRLENLLDQENPQDPGEVFTGYLQCQWIGKFMVAARGNEVLGKLLKEHQNESIARNFRRLIKGRDRVDEAVQEVFGYSVDQLFRLSHQAMTEALRRGAH